MSTRRAAGLAVALSLISGVARAELEVRLVDERGARVDVARSGVDLVRTPPGRVPDGPTEENAYRPMLVGSAAEVAAPLGVESLGEGGARLDVLARLPTAAVPCPADAPTGAACRVGPPIRLALDESDRRHPVSRDRSVVAELGGTLALTVGDKRMLAARVLGPRRASPPIDVLRARLRVFVVRATPKGAPPFGLTEAASVVHARAQVKRANVIWGQCGVTFGRPDKADVQVVDPPLPHMIAVGCDLGLPASGGELRARVDGKDLAVTTAPGELPRDVARRLARAADALGLVAIVSDNLRIGPAAHPTADVLFRRRDGSPALVEAPSSARGRGLSTDPTLLACAGGVDFSDGLSHFTDVDAVAGTVEERSLLKAYDDGDPGTIEVFLVPAFATGGRIGESFIRGDHGALPDMLIEDRAGVRADAISFALAHELGHVLLDVPGHSDDFGVDTPSRLMDSDAADPSPFGPRRLSVAECERAVLSSGPGSVAPMLLPEPRRPKDRRR